MKKYLYLIILLALLFGCRGQSKGQILAEVNKDVLYKEDFIAMIGEQNYAKLDAEAQKKAVEDWVNVTLLAQMANERKLHKKAGVQERLKMAAKKVRANALIAERLSTLQISEEQLFSYFRIHQAEFTRPMMLYNIQRIALRDKIRAESVFEQINEGLDFSEALRRFSMDANPMVKGNIGFVGPDSADSLFWLGAKELEINQAGILKQGDTWYVYRFTEEKESDTVVNFEDFKAEIRHKILLEKQGDIYRDLLREAKAKSPNIYYY